MTTHGASPTTGPTGTTPLPRRLDPAPFAAWNANQRRARDAYAEHVAHPRCGRCSWPETPTHACKT